MRPAVAAGKRGEGKDPCCVENRAKAAIGRSGAHLVRRCRDAQWRWARHRMARRRKSSHYRDLELDPSNLLSCDGRMTALRHTLGDGAYRYDAPLKPIVTRSDFAWEFLRRNPGYGQVARESRGTGRSTQSVEEALRPWGLQFLADPTLPAGAVDVFWRPDVAPGLVVRLEQAQAEWASRLRLGANLALQRRASNGLHLLLPSGLQIHVPNGDLSTPLAAILPISGVFSVHLRSAHRLQRALAGDHRPLDDLTGQQRKRLIQTLRALDLAADQRNYREIAAALFGQDAAERGDWRTCSVRDTVIRLVRSGRALVAGGYRRILAGA